MNNLQSNTLLSLFNAVLKKDGSGSAFNNEFGFYVTDGGEYAEKTITKWFKSNKLSGNDLNKTFHKSWATVRDSSRFELYLEQIRHYLSTYGTNFTGEVYIPDEVLDLPNVKLKVKVISALSKDEIVEKALGMLTSGVALKESTVDELLDLLDSFKYTFTGKEGIRNKEAVIKIAERFGVVPHNTADFMRYIVYRSTGSTLLIKNLTTIEAIKSSSYNPVHDFRKFGVERLAQVFNRFKPLFLAYKGKCPAEINRISKLSKTLHKPMVTSPLNEVTSKKLVSTKGLEKATVFAIFKALSAVYNRLNGQTTFAYRVRNGKGYAKDGLKSDTKLLVHNYNMLVSLLRERVGKKLKLYIPEGVEYALPTSEKMFVGNIPTGTRFLGKRLAVGVYWRNSWGAYDIDLSGIDQDGYKVGWDSSYCRQVSNGDRLLYSGDITDAKNGAVEYLHSSGKVEPTLVQTNVFRGEDTAGYKIVIGKGSKISKDFMMNPNKVFAEVQTKGVQKQMILGLLSQDGDQNAFTLLDFGAGSLQVSGMGRNTKKFLTAAKEQWTNPISLNDVIEVLGWETVEDVQDADVDLSLDALERDTFVKMFA